MTAKLPTKTISSPLISQNASVDTVLSGVPIPPIERIKLFSAGQWEDFILEWADSIKSKYSSVAKYAGAGDMGCDIIAIINNAGGGWDNYQCKHYKNPLTPSDIWCELGKLVYYTSRGDYTYPKHYYFVAPQGAGTKLSRLLKDQTLLRAELINNWEEYCSDKVTEKCSLCLDYKLKSYIDSLDFSIFEAIPPLRIIDEHAKTKYYPFRFGGGLPPRPPAAQPPTAPTSIEANYLCQLLKAYADHLKCKIDTVNDISDINLLEHLHDSRLEFYSAESLRMFSRDTLPCGEFEKFQGEIHDGIKDELRVDHIDGYKRILAVVKAARALQLTSHALTTRVVVRDRGGICHQLANDNIIWWVK